MTFVYCAFDMIQLKRYIIIEFYDVFFLLTNFIVKCDVDCGLSLFSRQA